jgi:cell division septum initiation protein DivIVA
MKSKKKLRPAGQSPLVTDAAERIAAIIDGAERAAARVIDDAEEQARRHLEEAQARADGVVAERLRALADEFDPPAAVERSEPHLKPVEAFETEPEVGGDGAAPRRAGSAGARLLATQMAVSGSSREEIESRLRSGFEIEDTSEILDAILGPEE